MYSTAQVLTPLSGCIVLEHGTSRGNLRKEGYLEHASDGSKDVTYYYGRIKF